MFLTILFYACASVAVIAAIAMILVNNPVTAVLNLIVVFIATAVLWLLLQAEFLAITLVLVYVGAVMVLFLFVIMMLNINFAVKKPQFSKYFFLGLLCGGILLTYFISNVNIAVPSDSIIVNTPQAVSNVELLGIALFTKYLYHLEIAGMLLLVAIIASIALSFRGKKPNSKYQNIATQLNATKANRLKLKHIDPESKIL
ncbi:MAG: NADH:ubiquinone oxidoreductase subunit J [Legionellales bacterium]|nr:MAG: NADH:ubiquinone oxidoreductase subunit J [Legionellales bacterium]